MQRMTVFCLVLALVGVASGQETWPKGVEKPKGLKVYERTNLTQYCGIVNRADYHDWFQLDQDDYSGGRVLAVNPNKKDSYRVPGGLDKAVGWKSELAVVLPKAPETFVQKVPIFMLERAVPKFRWQYAPGTQFFDVLSRDGKCFELRRRLKEEDGSWLSTVVWRDGSAAPSGYSRAGDCNACHAKAGGSEAYAITVRGDDTVFSFLPELK